MAAPATTPCIGGNGNDVVQFLKSEGLNGTDVCADFVQGQDKISFSGYGINFSNLMITSRGTYSSVALTMTVVPSW